MWCVQRCSPNKNYSGEKVSDYAHLDYMGSAEFEFGTIPFSIRKMGVRNLVTDKLTLTNKKHHTFNIHILAAEDQMQAAKDAIKKYLEGKDGARHLKEYISLGDKFDENEYGKDRKDNLWWCVDEHGKHSMNGSNEQRNAAAKDDEKPTFAFSLNPEFIRCFKLALAVSFDYMNKQNA